MTTSHQVPSTAGPWLTGAAQRWFERRSLGADDVLPASELAAIKRSSGLRISVALPALNEGDTVGPICETIAALRSRTGLVDEIVVLDGGSTDGTAVAAHAGGARVVRVAQLMPDIPLHHGKGESLWRSLSILDGDIVCWLDADIENFSEHFVTRLVGPLLTDPTLTFVKAAYRRPITAGDVLLPSGGGRVTELTARPLLSALFPELAGFLQPLSGEYAGRREALESVPFFTGYGVEVGLLIDLLELSGLDSMAQMDLDERVHRNRPLEELAPMAYAVAQTILRRAEEWGRIKATIDYPSHPLLQTDASGRIAPAGSPDTERPPLAAFMPTRELAAGDGVVLP